MKRLAGVVLLALVSQSALTVSADARPRHHRQIAVPAEVEPSSFGVPSFPSFLSGTNDVVQKARQYLGAGAIFGRSNLWCARFVNYVLEKTGHHSTGSDAAASFNKLPSTSMHVGAIAVMGRRGGGHVGVVSGIDKGGNPIIISGNHGNRVREAVYPRSRIRNFVNPT